MLRAMAWWRLERQLRKGDDDAFRDALERMRSLDPQRTVSTLLRLADPGESKGRGVSRRILEALGESGDARAVPVLLNLLDVGIQYFADDQPFAVSDALVRLRHPRAVRPLVAFALSHFVKGAGDSVREQYGSGRLDGRVGYFLMQDAMQMTGEVAERAFRAAVSIDRTRTVKALVEECEGPKWERRRKALELLLELGDRRCVKPVVKVALRDGDLLVRMRAVDVLHELADETMAPLLVKALRGTLVRDRQRAAELLVTFATPDCVDALLAATRDHDETVRKHAKEALERLDGPPS